MLRCRGSGNRITPAYAGNTCQNQYGNRQQKDHPRIRGEHAEPESIKGCARGSPPHTRGTLACRCTYVLFGRITPAYAGNTPSAKSDNILSQDHPRIRGEHSGVIIWLMLHEGSPPHTRGTQVFQLSQSGIRGITPAYAGNTLRK